MLLVGELVEYIYLWLLNNCVLFVLSHHLNISATISKIINVVFNIQQPYTPDSL
jgi:hypothetical protein